MHMDYMSCIFLAYRGFFDLWSYYLSLYHFQVGNIRQIFQTIKVILNVLRYFAFLFRIIPYVLIVLTSQNMPKWDTNYIKLPHKCYPKCNQLFMDYSISMQMLRYTFWWSNTVFMFGVLSMSLNHGTWYTIFNTKNVLFFLFSWPYFVLISFKIAFYWKEYMSQTFFTANWILNLFIGYIYFIFRKCFHLCKRY